jgi:hypothetical protein
MRRNRRELGEGQGGCIVGLIIFVALIFIAWKLIPVKVKAAELRQEVVDEAKSAGTHSDDRIRKAILAKAAELELPVTTEDVTIKRHANEIAVEVDYVVPVAFPGYTYNMKFSHSADNPIF